MSHFAAQTWHCSPGEMVNMMAMMMMMMLLMMVEKLVLVIMMSVSVS